MLRVNNILFDPEKIIYVIQDHGDVNKVTVVFLGGEKLVFKGAEAAELWKELDSDDRDWRNND